MNREQIKEKRRQAGDALYRQRFVDFGLSDQFEYVHRIWESDKGRLVTIKCKQCGNVFATWNVDAYFRGKVKSISCPECGMRSDGKYQWTKTTDREEAITYYLQGHTRNEIAAKFGISVTQLDNELRMKGIKKTQEQRRAAWLPGLKNASATANRNAAALAERARIEHLDLLGFDYSGCDGNTGRARCRKCGHEIERTLAFLTRGNVVCPNCRKAKRENDRRIKQEQTEERMIQREADRKAKNPLGLSYYQLAREKKLDVVCTCKECGKDYTPRQYMESAGVKSFSNPGFCSAECRKRASRNKQKDLKHIRHRANHFGCVFDSSVTLKKLIERNGLRCEICGGICDQNDHTWSEYFGPMSPTIDHIKPLSKGGSHTWDNVQVAHAICNSRKKDTYEAS